jgi:hypothetical protein
MELARLKVGTVKMERRWTPHPPGNADDYENKGIAGKAIRKTMKIKGEQNLGCRRQ